MDPVHSPLVGKRGISQRGAQTWSPQPRRKHNAEQRREAARDAAVHLHRPAFLPGPFRLHFPNSLASRCGHVTCPSPVAHEWV